MWLPPKATSHMLWCLEALQDEGMAGDLDRVENALVALCQLQV
jgi:hypothetical protein